ncbi:MAG: nucleoside deaminase [Bacteroidales bacterium]|jgi:tRNA(Arg) A34 adenosine deaminase TadA|nr:nucleoside deaminase [Bacteroidales bacterium]HBG88238.1 tRNA-specific adenosine deaminase [Marinilabiliaceae bacterium]HBX89531.1 tRNA-specific adenosine deaminase [Marinilabiliaceae bacterium]
MQQHGNYMQEAIALANRNIENGGGPFGALIVRKGEIVGRGGNQVTMLNDPTAHAEVMAIRDATKTLGTYNLSDCVLYTTCEPCPMCMGAIYWARISHVYYGNNRKDAANIGFDDELIYRELALPINQRSVLMEPLLSEDAISTFKRWQEMPDKKEY